MGLFGAGELVRVSNVRSLSYGRICMVTTGADPRCVTVRFVDLPDLAPSELRNPTGLTAVFSEHELTALDVEFDDQYLLVLIIENNNGFESTHRCLAACKGENPKAVADRIAAEYYGEGEWSEEDQWYVFDHTRIWVDNWQELNLSQWVALLPFLDNQTA